MIRNEKVTNIMLERSSDQVMKQIVKSILEGEYQINDSLLAERELALFFGVGRPTVREALQRLEREGWITFRKGMPPVVNDYWKHGNLMTIVNMLQNYDEIPDLFIEYMLELRVALTPSYMRDALEQNRLKVISLFADIEDLKDNAANYAHFDWKLQQNIAGLSANPMYLLILNSFKEIYIPMAEKYFAHAKHREASRLYYETLLKSILAGDISASEDVTKNMMKDSLHLWKNNNE